MQTERAIQTAPPKLSCGRTTLAVAYRLATIRYADRNVVLHETGIAEQGHTVTG